MEVEIQPERLHNLCNNMTTMVATTTTTTTTTRTKSKRTFKMKFTMPFLSPKKKKNDDNKAKSKTKTSSTQSPFNLQTPNKINGNDNYDDDDYDQSLNAHDIQDIMDSLYGEHSSKKSSSSSSSGSMSLQPFEFLTENPKYLLRLCHYGNPRHIIKVCHIIQQVGLASAAATKATASGNKFSVEQERLRKACYNQLLRRTKYEEDMAFSSAISSRSIPLHVLCGRMDDTSSSIADAVRAMLQAADALAGATFGDNESSLLRNLALQTNSQGETPLITTCRTGVANPDVLRSLLDHPSGRASVLFSDKEGYSPMMCLASYHGYQYNTHESDLEEDEGEEDEEPERSYSSRTVLAGLLQTSVDDEKDDLETSSSLSSSSSSSNQSVDTDTCLQRHQMATAWNDVPSCTPTPMEWILQLIRVAWEEQNRQLKQKQTRTNDEDYHLWTAVATMADKVPTVVVDYLFQVSPPPQTSDTIEPLLDQALSQSCRYDSALLSHQQAYFIQRLVFDTSLSFKGVLDKSSSSLLTKVLQAGWTWTELPQYHQYLLQQQQYCCVEDDTTTTTTTNATTISPNSLVQQLVRHHPEGLLTYDDESGFVPFQSATIQRLKMDYHRSPIQDYVQDLTQLDTIYQLLLHAPEQIAIATTTPTGSSKV